jgi:Cu/Ag efflux protein CusF
MKKAILMTTLLALPFALSACNKPTDEPKAQEPADEMGSMTLPVETKLAKGSGTVTAIDKSAGKITIKHGPIADLQWPAMTMGFASKPELLNSVAVGDKVDFDVTVTGNAGEVNALTKR